MLLQALSIHDLVRAIYRIAKDKFPRGMDSVKRATYLEREPGRFNTVWDMFANHNIEFMGSGSYRAVFAIGDNMVMKVDVSRCSGSNTSELNTFNKVQSSNVRYLVNPIISSGTVDGNSFLIFPKVVIPKFPIESKNTLQNMMLGRICGKFGDSHQYNLGVFNGGMVILDYEMGGSNLNIEIDEDVATEWDTYTKNYDKTVERLKAELKSTTKEMAA